MTKYKIEYSSIETDSEPGQNYGVTSNSYKEIEANSEEEAKKIFNEKYGIVGTAENRIEKVTEV